MRKSALFGTMLSLLAIGSTHTNAMQKREIIKKKFVSKIEKLIETNRSNEKAENLFNKFFEKPASFAFKGLDNLFPDKIPSEKNNFFKKLQKLKEEFLSTKDPYFSINKTTIEKTMNFFKKKLDYIDNLKLEVIIQTHNRKILEKKSMKKNTFFGTILSFFYIGQNATPNPKELKEKFIIKIETLIKTDKSKENAENLFNKFFEKPASFAFKGLDNLFPDKIPSEKNKFFENLQKLKEEFLSTKDPYFSINKTTIEKIMNFFKKKLNYIDNLKLEVIIQAHNYKIEEKSST